MFEYSAGGGEGSDIHQLVPHLEMLEPGPAEEDLDGIVQFDLDTRNNYHKTLST